MFYTYIEKTNYILYLFDCRKLDKYILLKIDTDE